MDRLWYRQPAAEWEEALPLGNGRLGAMVYGGITQEQIQVNEESMWYGTFENRINPSAASNLPKIRELIRNGEIRRAQELMSLSLTGCPEGVHPYQTLGDIYFSFDTTEQVAEYARSLDLESATCSISYQTENTQYDRKMYISKPANCMVIRLTANGTGKINTRIKLGRGKYFDGVEACGNDGICLHGNLGKGGFDFAMMLRTQVKNGNIHVVGETLVIEDTNEAILYFAADTTYHFTDKVNLQDVLYQRLKIAMSLGEESVYAAHLQDYQRLYHRMFLQLGEETINDVPTDIRLQRCAKEDMGLTQLLFCYGRYLMISSSRPGDLPATLQGIWNYDFLPPWDSKYTININAEMNYWPAECCNLSECHEPLFMLLGKMQIHGREVAEKMYGCRGFVAHHNTDMHGDCAPQDLWIPATYWVMGAAWLCTHLWTHYQYTKDVHFLKEAYPVMAESALFFLDFLEEKDGILVTNPSCSPENTYILPSGERGCCCIGASMDSQILRDLFTECESAAAVLGDFVKDIQIPKVEDTVILQKEISAAIKKLPPISVDSKGRIMEWMEEYEEEEPGHRHISHLYALYPSDQITVDETPILAKAARKTLEYRLSHGGGHTGWSRAWITNHYAKLHSGDEAWESIEKMLTDSTYPNLFDKHPPFQIDGNFGVTAAIAQMLVQSREGIIFLLPALPSVWKNGQIKGVCIVGNATVDLKWEDGLLTECEIATDGTYEGVAVYRDIKQAVHLNRERKRIKIHDSKRKQELGVSEQLF